MIRKLASNAFSNYASLGISIVIALIMSPFLVHRLGDFFYGIWALIMAVTGYFSLLDFGMNRAIVRYVSMYEATGQKEELNRFYNTTLVLYSLIGLVTIAATVVFALICDHFIDMKEYAFMGKLVILLVGIDFGFTFPFSVMYAVLIGRQEHTVANRINIVNAVTRNVCLYATLSFFPNLISLAVVNVLFNFSKSIRFYFVVRKKCPYIVYSTSCFDRGLIPQILNYSGYSFVVSASSRVINFTDEIVVATFLKVGDVTFYSIAVNLITYFEKMIWAGASVFVPYISQLDAQGEHEVVRDSFFRGSKYTLLVTLYIYSGILLFGGTFVSIWMGPKYGEVVQPILMILATSKVIFMSQSMSVARFFGTSRHQLLGKLNIVEAACNLVLSVTLVQFYGMLGVAFGTLIPSCILNGILLPSITFREFNLSYRDFFLKSVLAPSGVFAATTATMYYLMGTAAAGYGVLVMKAGVMTLVFCLFSILLVTDTRERTYIFSKMRSTYET